MSKVSNYIGSISLSITVFLWAYSIFSTPVITKADLNVTFGLFEAMPFWYVLSIVFSVIAIVIFSFEKGYMRFISSIFILSLIIFGTPFLVEEYPRQWDTYWHTYSAKYIIDYGGIPEDMEGYKMADFYIKNWPSFYFLFAIIIKITNFDFITFLKTYNIWLYPVIFFCTYVFFRTYIKDRLVARIGLLIFILINFYIPILFSQSVLSLVLIPLIMITISKNGFESKLIFVVLLTALIFIHPTTSIYFVIFFTILSIIRFIPINKSEKILGNQERTYFVVTILIFTAYQIYLATSSFNGRIRSIIDTLYLSVDKQNELTTYRFFEFLPARIRIIFFILLISICMIYIIIYVLRHKTLLEYYTILLVSGLSFIFMNYMLGMGFLGRTVIYSSYPIAMLVGKIISSTSKNDIRIVTILVLLLLPATYTFYWDEALQAYSKKDIYEFQRAYNVAENNYLITNNIYPPNFDSPIFLANSSYNVTNVRVKRLDDIKYLKAVGNDNTYFILFTDRMIMYENIHRNLDAIDTKDLLESIDRKYNKMDDFGGNVIYNKRIYKE